MAENALQIVKMSSFCERLVFFNGYVRKENQRYGPSWPNVCVSVTTCDSTSTDVYLRARLRSVFLNQVSSVKVV